MEKYVCIHGHFYQPPRENPWLEFVELQDSAFPYHDWNERITTECYAPNAVARVFGSDGKIARLVNNYARISFNFGPTLLAWMQERAPDVYRRILEADQESRTRFSDHGSALAQVYNHIIMPLADRTDKITQVVWGIRDFQKRFGRDPEGMWLAETAVDLETLDVLAEHGIRFTILAPNQASKIRPVGNGDWQDVSGSHIDPSRPYLKKLPSGRSIVLFFYDGPISRAVAFEKLLIKGETLAERLSAAFVEERDWPQLIHMATDGESYGHHHAHGDMALAYALDHIEATGKARLTNYGEYLSRYPPQWEVEIFENSSWSCVHGVERWRSDCGCNSGRPGWQQKWREPLRKALDVLRDACRAVYTDQAGALVRDPWAARNDYLDVVLDRRPETLERYFEKHERKALNDADKCRVLKLLEMQRHALLMYTSCGWFFDEISGIESAQVLMYAGRVQQLAHELGGDSLERRFLEELAKAPSNVPELYANGKEVFEKLVRPAQVGWRNMAAHYAVSSVFEPYEESARLFCFRVNRRTEQTFEAGKVRLLVGQAALQSDITLESADFAYAALHLGDHNVNAAVAPYPGDEEFQQLGKELAEVFARVDTPQILRLMDRHFGESSYSIASLFRDSQRAVLKRLLRAELAEVTAMYHRVFTQNLPLMQFLRHLSAPLPLPLQATAQVLFNTDLRWALKDDDPDFEQIRTLVNDARTWGVSLDTNAFSFRFTRMLARAASRWKDQPDQIESMLILSQAVDLAREMPFQPDLWTPQNVFVDLADATFATQARAAADGVAAAGQWVEMFLALGLKLGIDVEPLKKKSAS
jgi:alpha-amylase/alpha-mannosidase (GH57 family)